MDVLANVSSSHKNAVVMVGGPFHKMIFILNIMIPLV